MVLQELMGDMTHLLALTFGLSVVTVSLNCWVYSLNNGVIASLGREGRTTPGDTIYRGEWVTHE